MKLVRRNGPLLRSWLSSALCYQITTCQYTFHSRIPKAIQEVKRSNPLVHSLQKGPTKYFIMDIMFSNDRIITGVMACWTKFKNGHHLLLPVLRKRNQITFLRKWYSLRTVWFYSPRMWSLFQSTNLWLLCITDCFLLEWTTKLTR